MTLSRIGSAFLPVQWPVNTGPDTRSSPGVDLQKASEPSAVVEMLVGDDRGIDGRNVDVEVRGVVRKGVGRSHVEEHPGTLVLEVH